MTDKKKPISKEEIAKILELYMKAKEEAGQKVETGTLYDGDNPEGKVIIDNRDENDLN
jgi:hypothetical protein